MKRFNVRRGFTLLELLVVISIIGVLSGGLMLTMGSSTDKAEAARIVSDLHSLKLAAGLFHADHAGETVTPDITSLKEYVSVPEKLSGGSYLFVQGSDSEQWFVGYAVENLSSGVRASLQKLAAASGLRKGTSIKDVDKDTYDGGKSGVFVRVK